MTTYYAIVDAGDGNTLPTRPDPVPLADMGAELTSFLRRYQAQGYYMNCRQERIPLDQIGFTIQPCPKA